MIAASALWAWVLSPCASVQAQSPPGAGTAQTITVSGAVFDSLAGEPLAGAFVVAAPSGATAVSDSTGRFVLEGDGPVTELTAYHAVLDSLGIGALRTARTQGSGNWEDAQLATPSLAALWPLVCGASQPSGMRSAIVTGTARLADGLTRVSGAKVLAQWESFSETTGEARLETRETQTDSIGNFALCGIERLVAASIAGVSDSLRSGLVRLGVSKRPVASVTLILAPSENGYDATVRGRVVDEDGAPRPDVSLEIEGHGETVRTDVNGAFRFEGVPSGSRMLNARAVGYSPASLPINVLRGENPSLEIRLASAIELERVTVTRRALVRRERAEIELRRAAGFGRFVDSTAIMRVPILRNALQMEQVVRIQAGSGTGFAIRGTRSNCNAHIYVDGIISDMSAVMSVPREDIAMVELYRSVSQAPARFIRVAADDCAVALFWTKTALRP